MLQQIGCFVGGAIFGAALVFLVLRNWRVTTTSSERPAREWQKAEAVPFSADSIHSPSSERPANHQRFDDRYFTMEP